MKLLITNDDGYDAEGIAALAAAAEGLGDITIAAPHEHQSGCSHQVTVSRPLRVEQHGPKRYSVLGTPADCVRMALHRLAPQTQYVLSGINHGGNLGADVYVSGTVAAVREAVIHGWPGIAVSHYLQRGRPADWGRAAAWLSPLLRDLMARPYERGSFWTINLPHPPDDAPDPEVVFCPLDPNPLPLSFMERDGQYHYNGDYHGRKREPGCDVDVCFGGKIAVTQIKLF